jgi:hypothetical protein
MNDPHTQMLSGILSQISQYERHLITTRSTRGVHDTINRGIRGFNQLYGYKKGGIQENGYMKWIPVKSEIENLKYLYQEFLGGTSIYNITYVIFKKTITEKNNAAFKSKLARLLGQFVYTGYSLTTDGLEMYNQYKRGGIDSIKELKDKKYYVKSLSYPEKLVSIENWIKVVEKLQVNRDVYRNKMRRTEKEMATGIIQCPYCELRYYYCEDKKFLYYKHYPKRLCGQLPKSFRIEKINGLFEAFLFYYYLVYDDTRNLITESQRIIKLNLLEIKEKINAIEAENKKHEKQISRFQSIYEETEDKDLLKLTLIKEQELNLKMDKNSDTLVKWKNELEELNKKYDEDELELTYYNVKDTIIDFFEKMTSDEKRISLVKIIKTCQAFGIFAVIDTGKLFFIFNTEENNILPEETYQAFKKDENFKDNFLNTSFYIDKNGNPTRKAFNVSRKNYDKFVVDFAKYFISRFIGERQIKEYLLMKTGKDKMKTEMEKRLQKLGIEYSLLNVEKIISFTEEF